MATSTEAAPARRRRRVWLDILAYGLAGGVLTAVLKLTEYRFLVVEHSVQILRRSDRRAVRGRRRLAGLALRRKKTVVVEKGALAPASFVLDESRRSALGITARELEILGLMAAGLSNREIADRPFINEKTVKTHSSRLFDKLGAKRRTQAVQIGKASRLIP